MPHETSSTLERPFRGARQRLRSKLGGLDRSTRLSVDGLLGVLASSNEIESWNRNARTTARPGVLERPVLSFTELAVSRA